MATGRGVMWALSHDPAVDRGLRNAYFAERGLGRWPNSGGTGKSSPRPSSRWVWDRARSRTGRHGGNPPGGNPLPRRAVCEQHLYGSVRAAKIVLVTGGGYSRSAASSRAPRGRWISTQPSVDSVRSSPGRRRHRVRVEPALDPVEGSSNCCSAWPSLCVRRCRRRCPAGNEQRPDRRRARVPGRTARTVCLTGPSGWGMADARPRRERGCHIRRGPRSWAWPRCSRVPASRRSHRGQG